MVQDHFQSFQEAGPVLRGFFYDCLLHLLPVLIGKKEMLKFVQNDLVIYYIQLNLADILSIQILPNCNNHRMVRKFSDLVGRVCFLCFLHNDHIFVLQSKLIKMI